jgi:hypothetical protein
VPVKLIWRVAINILLKRSIGFANRWAWHDPIEKYSVADGSTIGYHTCHWISYMLARDVSSSLVSRRVLCVDCIRLLHMQSSWLRKPEELIIFLRACNTKFSFVFLRIYYFGCYVNWELNNFLEHEYVWHFIGIYFSNIEKIPNNIDHKKNSLRDNYWWKNVNSKSFIPSQEN